MSHVSFKLREGWVPCEVAAMGDCLVSEDAETCLSFKDPDDCPKYRRVMILEGEIQRAGWEFNCFKLKDFADFWLLCEREWAEAEKKLLYYPEGNCAFCGRDDCSNCEDNPDPKEAPCDYGFSEECVEPSLRGTNCCFECWLYGEVDSETQKVANSASEEAEASEDDWPGVSDPFCPEAS